MVCMTRANAIEPLPRSALRRTWLAALLLPLLCGAAASAPPKAAPLRKISATIEGDALRPGGASRIVVTVTLSPEFHVNSHTPSQDYLIPTSLETEASDGLDVGAWRYPVGERKHFAFSEEPIQVYEGSFRIEGEIKAPAGLPPSRRNVRLHLKYQACTADRCYPPKKEPITVPVTIVAQGS